MTTHTQNPIPVYLITGLLGSGKTTLLSQIVNAQPAGKKWALLINEFGEIDIDSILLQNTASTSNTILQSVKGGCICCTASHQMQQALSTLIAEQPDAIWIEPTGLGHSTGLIDTLAQFPQLRLKLTLGLITPKQLTQERWKKSAVMRDIVTLADAVLVTQTDLATHDETESALTLLTNLYPKKVAIFTDYLQLDLAKLQTMQPIPFKIRENAKLNTPIQTLHLQNPFSTITAIRSISIQIDATTQQIKTIGLDFVNTVIFNRLKLKAFFEEHATQICRAKGLLRTGKEWQLLQWQGEQLQLSEIAWRQDSRIELLLNDNCAWQLQANQILPAGANTALQNFLCAIINPH